MINIHILLILLALMFITLIVYQKQLINLKKELREFEKRYNSDCFDIKLNEYVREQERQRNAIKHYVGPMQYAYRIDIDSKGKESINLVALPSLNQVTAARIYGDVYPKSNDSSWRS